MCPPKSSSVCADTDLMKAGSPRALPWAGHCHPGIPHEQWAGSGGAFKWAFSENQTL